MIGLPMPPSSPQPGTSASPGRWNGYLKALGPGLLWAGAAIGVSHLVQSTRAGADYGLSLVWMILLCLALKYPLFEYGHRYVAATGEDLIRGYRRLGRGDLWLFLVLCVLSGFIALAAVTMVTGALVAHLFPGTMGGVPGWSALILAGCLVILIGGRFAWLDGIVKIVILTLTVATLVAVGAAFFHGAAGDLSAPTPPMNTGLFLAFLIALLGWMPAPIEFAAISSLWIRQRQKQTRHTGSLGEALFDFRVGYLTTALLSVAFVALGALVLFGTGLTFENSAIQFSRQLVHLYTSSIGDWAAPVIGVAAVATMFSTTITVLDGYPRAIDATLAELFPGYRQAWGDKVSLSFWLVLTALIAGVIIYFGTGVFAGTGFFFGLITVATTAAFLAGPIFGWINLRLVTSEHVSPEFRPGKVLTVVSWLGILLLTTIGLLYLWKLFIGF